MDRFNQKSLQVTDTKTWERLGFVSLLHSRNRNLVAFEIGHWSKTGLYKRKLTNSLLFSLPQVVPCSRSLNNKLQTDHRHGWLSTRSRIMPNAEEETSQTGSSGASGPVPTLETQTATARPPSAFIVNKVNNLETKVAQILSLLQSRPLVRPLLPLPRKIQPLRRPCQPQSNHPCPPRGPCPPQLPSAHSVV